MGNLFTHYNYTQTDIKRNVEGDRIEIKSEQSDFKLIVEKSDKDVSLPSDSPFTEWKQARKFAGPLPFTFTYDKNSKEVLIIEGVRQNWTPQPVKVIEHKISFLDQMKLEERVLANAFVVENVPYHWKKGRVEKWRG